MKHWQKWTMRSYEEDRQNLTDEGGIMLNNEEIITLSVSVASQPGTDSSCRTMSTCPCSQAHMSAVEPSSSRRFTWAPQDSRALTMSPLPWLTASISAVCPAYNTHTPISITHRLTRWGTLRDQKGAHLAGFGVDVSGAVQLQDGLKVTVRVKGSQSCQHDSCVTSLVLLVSITETYTTRTADKSYGYSSVTC